MAGREVQVIDGTPPLQRERRFPGCEASKSPHSAIPGEILAAPVQTPR
jgi:hypothetical protein